MTLDKSKKSKMLVVDDEPDNLDLLYRTFRRDFNVLRAESGIVALEILATEGEVAVIISDQRMPEMKGTEFLSKTVPQFPDTMRIILTGFTDVEDLVEAINSGQVYKYITKPWDPNELKTVVQRAAETYDLLKQRTEELKSAQAQLQLISRILQSLQQVESPEACLQQIAAIYQQAFSADCCILQLIEAGSLGRRVVSGTHDSDLSQDPLVSQACSTGTIQAVGNIPADANLAAFPAYAAAGTQAHWVVPVTFQSKLLAIIALQWQQPHTLDKDVHALLDLSSQQVGMALACAL